MVTQKVVTQKVVTQKVVTQKVSMWGNSLGVRLPQTIIQQMGLKPGDLITISTEGNRIILSSARPRYTLDQLLKDVTPDKQHDEMDWGELVGEESW